MVHVVLIFEMMGMCMKKFREFYQQHKKEIGLSVLSIIITLCIAAGIFVYWGQYKVIWFCDEIYSYFTANSAYSIGNRLEYGVWYDSDFVIDDMTPEHGRYFFRTRHNVRTDDHPPIYFITMHLMSLLAGRSISKWVGLSINFICFLGIALFTYAFLYLVTRKKVLSVLGAAALLCLPSLLTCSMLIRMYCMMTAWAVLFVLLSYLLWAEIGKRKVHKIILHLLLAGVTAFGFLTQYYFAVFAVGFTAVYGICCLAEKKWKKILSYLGSMLLGVWIATYLWPDWIYQLFFQYCGEAVFSQAGNWDGLWKEIAFGLTVMPRLMFYRFYIIGMVLIVAGMAFLIYKKDEKLPVVAMTMGSTLFYSLVVAHVTPSFYLDYRYFYMATVVMYLGFLVLLVRCISYLPVTKYTRYIPVIVPGFLILFNALTAQLDGMAMGYVDKTNEYNRKRAVLSEYKELPWVVYGYENWTLMETYYDLALGERFIVYSDTVDFEDGRCIGDGQDFLLFFNNSFEYDEEQILDRLNQTDGCNHEIEYLFRKGSEVYLVKHIH